ncbi:hypothetical protein ES703_60606 [subsurface metagenome]
MSCEVCGNELSTVMSDFHNEAECIYCGAPHQIGRYSGAPEGQEYPYITLSKDFIPIFREYWTTFNRRCRIGMHLGPPTEIVTEVKHLVNWLRATHPKYAGEG